MNAQNYRTTFLASIALLAFAGNSVLCRLALIDNSIDPLSFTAVRLTSGALILLLLVFSRSASAGKTAISNETGSWYAAIMLFAYAVLFSWAYVSMDTATGALILFASVQITMVLMSLIKGNRLSLGEWLGLLVSAFGFIYLVAPEVQKPSMSGFVMMMFSGVAWAAYTIKGQAAQDALRVTAFNFLRTIPLLLVLLIVMLGQPTITSRGVLLAVASGAITSGLGYAVWYAALQHLATTNAAVIQLLVPILAAIGGLSLAGEALSMRLVVSALLVLGGILLVVKSKHIKS
ncbi:MAG: drug/metabolite transporter (DMT)-like permease [Cryomorphaceae bacterium]